MSTMLYGKNTRCVEPPEPCSSNFMPSLSVHTMTVNCRLRLPPRVLIGNRA